MVRYVRQRDRFRCGPIAILNALKWAGAPVTAKMILPEITAAAHCVYPDGTQPVDFKPALVAFGERFFSIRTVPLPRLASIEHCLRDENRAVLLMYSWFDPGSGYALCAHYALLTGVSARGKHFAAVNFCFRQPQRVWDITSCVSRAELRGFLYRRKDPEEGGWYPTSWFLTKKHARGTP